MKNSFNPNYFGAPILERKFNENHGPDGKFASSDGPGAASATHDTHEVFKSKQEAHRVGMAARRAGRSVFVAKASDIRKFGMASIPDSIPDNMHVMYELKPKKA